LSFSQTSVSDIRGNLICEDGSVLPGVSVTLIGNMGGEKTALSNDEGSYVFAGLLPGSYRLKFEREGFCTVVREGIRLLGDKNVMLNIKMKFSSLSFHSEEEKKIAAGERYRASGLHQFFFGRDYRRLWVEPTLPPELEGTIADRVVQDQISSSHPASPLVVEPLMEAAGILHTKVRLVVMPDDPALGEFRDEFADVLGTFQEYPLPISDTNPGFAGATEILDHLEMWSRLEASPADRVDSRAFLKARLLDLYISDWDRHRKQWRWAKIPGKSHWQPIPEDRDQAFCRYDGFLISAMRPSLPFIVNFGEKYARMDGLTFASRDADRYLLTDLKRSEWESIAMDLKESLTDSVIKAAIERLPPEYYRLDGSRLEATLKVRRDHLLEAADRFYKLLARRVNVQLTDQAEFAEIIKIDDKTTEIRVSLRPSKNGDSPPEPYYLRRFYDNETQEIRIYLRGGDDFVVSRGGRQKSIKIRIICGTGEKMIDDSDGGGLQVYDSTGILKLNPGPGTKFNDRKYTPPIIPSVPWIPPRDWGKQTISFPLLSYGPDSGLFLGGGFITKFFGFRKSFASRLSWRIPQGKFHRIYFNRCQSFRTGDISLLWVWE
jgi:hypothetical protein